MTTTYTAEQIESIGGRRWEGRTGVVRVYLNADVWAPMIGLEVGYYKSGSISWAELGGSKLSNSKAGQLLAGKVYWENGRVTVFGHAIEQHAEEIRDGIAAAVAPLAPVDPAAVIARLRAAGRTVREIAAAVGVHASTVYRWARSMFRPTAARAAALAAIAA